MCGEQEAWWALLAEVGSSGGSGKLCRGCAEVTASGQGGSLAKCFGKVPRQEASSVLEGTGV